MRLVTAAVVMALAGSGPAMAQTYWGSDYPDFDGPRRYYDEPRAPYYGERERYAPAYRGLPMRAIVGAVREEGFEPIARPVLRDNRYVVMSRDSYGRIHRVVVEARTGEIIRVVAARPDASAREPVGREPVARAPDYDRGDNRGTRQLPPLNRSRANAPEVGPADEATPQRPNARPSTPKPRPAQTARATETPPMPRARPTDLAPGASGPAAKHSPAKSPSAKLPTAKPPSKPARVILPGGPVPKDERSAGRAYAPGPTPPESTTPASAPSQPQPATPAETPPAATGAPAPTEAAPPAPAPATPAAEPAPSAGQPDPSIPPAQALD